MPAPRPEPTTAPRTTTTLIEAVVVVALCFGWTIQASLRSLGDDSPVTAFSDAELLSILTIEALVSALALVFLALRGYAIASLRPMPTWRDSAFGVGLLAACWIGSVLVALPFAAQGASEPIRQMVTQAHLSMPVIVLVSALNAVFEETFLLAVLLRGLRGLGASTALGLSLLVRLLYHLYQGPVGALTVTAFGLGLGLFYVRTGRLWPVIVAHALTDVAGFALGSE